MEGGGGGSGGDVPEEPVSRKRVTVNEESNSMIVADGGNQSGTSSSAEQHSFHDMEKEGDGDANAATQDAEFEEDGADRDADHPECPEEHANVFSRVFLLWVVPLILLGWKQPLDDHNMWELRQKENANHLVPRFEGIYEETEPNKKGQRFAQALMRSQKSLLVVTGILKAVDVALGAVQPVFVNRLLVWYQDPTAPTADGYIWSVALLLAPAFKAIVENQYFLGTFRGGLRVRAQIQGLLYNKALRMSPTARAGSSVGQVVNLMQLDSEKIATFCQFLHAAWGAPVQFFVSVGLLYNYIGPSSLIGLAFTFITIPLQGKLLKWQTGIVRKNTAITDRRVKITNEVLQGIKAVKFYAWERPFGREVEKVRENELNNLRKTITLKAMFLMILFAIPALVAVITFAFYIGVFGNDLDPSRIFTALSLLNNLRVPLMMFPFVVNSLIESRISVKRLERFLGLEETEDYARASDSSAEHHGALSKLKETDDETAESAEEKQEDVMRKATQPRVGLIEMKNGEFTWGARGTVQLSESQKKSKKEKKGKKKPPFSKKKVSTAAGGGSDGNVNGEDGEEEEVEVGPVLRDISLKCRPGELTVVVGRVGSGKSSLVQAMLGEIKKLSGEVVVHGSVAYVPQTAWIFNGTLQDNILFGEAMDDERYAQALLVSSLEADLDVLPGADMTAIGEKGINLSGGQKQRVSIARAVYAAADVYVMDDPLSALDPHVGKAVFDQCLSKRGVLRHTTRVLVTNQLQYVPDADQVIWLENGQVKMQGTYRQLMSTEEEFVKLMAESNGEDNNALAEAEAALVSESQQNRDAAREQELRHINTTRLMQKVSTNMKRRDTLMSKEDRNTGSIGMRSYLDYMKATGGYVLFTALLVFFAFTTAIGVINNWWLSFWSEQEATNPGRYSLAFYLGIYFMLAIGFAILTFIRTVLFLFAALRASRTIHSRCYNSVTHAPMEFFDTTPIGRIIARFSRDVAGLDTQVPQSWQQFLNTTLNLLSSYILVAVITPLFIVVAVPVGAGYFALQRFYNRTNLETKRLDSISKSPIYAHFSETLGGLSSIRAYRKQNRFRDVNIGAINGNHRAYFAQIASNRWFSMWLEILGSTLIFFAALFGVLGKGRIYSGLVGLSLTYALQVTSFLGFTVRSITELEAQMNAVERLEFYANKVPQEAPYIIEDKRPPTGWPSLGAVAFKDLKLRYRKDLDLVLKGVSLDIGSGTKVGIVGRTGAGKSSLMVAMLRLVEPTSGTIVVDDLDITTIGLEDLRTRITIIPQDPVMFSGSIRFNLDPFKEFDDPRLWDVLEKAHLKSFVSSLEGGLDGLVSEYGENLSAGQRQLICLARALLRKPRVLIMDEATSSVDHETDQMIQDTVREEFADATILTIAHRLWTIADYDQVLVMDNGVVGEYGPPSVLLENPDGFLTSMVSALGAAQSQTFRSMVSSRTMGASAKL
eukprot:CAMPEP_0185848574 /NCGR_PEP_ID=MMETSP1354-20130828/3399_1 /TAXON_ID=708628 /ORGANISM="Erythrolobus madagascarensis, Strain CCMP3276" /LENGTH=1448 /DNA_ID=CAMNT_0028548985 /DNA_START=55 /DNA_END=4401 /DNA_ORIENTATION=+